jgi:hypothetical protein
MITEKSEGIGCTSMRELDRALESADHAYLLECKWLESEIKELNRRDVNPGDGDLPSKAKRVLEMGARHISEGRPSTTFMQWVAVSILRTLNGKEHRLDHAFRIENPSNRPKKDPYSDPAIKAALAHLYEQSHLDSLNADSVRKEALDIAYAVRWKNTPERHKALGVEAETIRSRKRGLDGTLRKLGH